MWSWHFNSTNSVDAFLVDIVVNTCIIEIRTYLNYETLVWISMHIQYVQKTFLNRKTCFGEQSLILLGCLSQVYGPEATMTGICKQAIEYITAAA